MLPDDQRPGQWRIGDVVSQAGAICEDGCEGLLDGWVRMVAGWRFGEVLVGHDGLLAKIESRPIKGKHWQYLFFLDMMGHIDEDRIRESCEKIKMLCSYYEWLGSYPRGDQQAAAY